MKEDQDMTFAESAFSARSPSLAGPWCRYPLDQAGTSAGILNLFGRRALPPFLRMARPSASHDCKGNAGYITTFFCLEFFFWSPPACAAQSQNGNVARPAARAGNLTTNLTSNSQLFRCEVVWVLTPTLACAGKHYAAQRVDLEGFNPAAWELQCV